MLLYSYMMSNGFRLSQFLQEREKWRSFHEKVNKQSYSELSVGYDFDVNFLSFLSDFCFLFAGEFLGQNNAFQGGHFLDQFQ